MNKRKTIEIMWVNVNVQEKKGKASKEEEQAFQPKTTLHLPTLFELYSQFCSTAPSTQIKTYVVIVATQTFDDDQTPSIC